MASILVHPWDMHGLPRSLVERRSLEPAPAFANPGSASIANPFESRNIRVDRSHGDRFDLDHKSEPGSVRTIGMTHWGERQVKSCRAARDDPTRKLD